jgi:hypothetical protein
MKRADWKPTIHSVLCEKHFQLEDYMTNTSKLGSLNINAKINNVLTLTKKYLKPNVVPSIFEFPSHLKKTVTPRKPPAKRKILHIPQS